MSRTITLFPDGTWQESEGPSTPPSEPDELPPGYLSPHFRKTEFDCNHCGQYGDMIPDELLVVLEDVRKHFGGKPVTINSGVRCPTHNRNVGGASNSMHLSHGAATGYPCAADIVVSGIGPDAVHSYLTTKYPDKYGIGKYNSFTHIDTRPNRARW